MLRAIKNLLAHNILTIAILLTIVIALLSLLSISNYVPDLKVSWQDKAEHIIAYFTLASSWLLVHKHYKFVKQSKIIIVVLILIYGIILEVLQGSLTTYRTFEYYDMLANAIGVVTAFLFYKTIYKIIQE